MRKILLATTALVAVTGVSHAEVSINGYYEFGYESVSDDQSTDVDDMYNDHEIHISFSSTTDTGLSFGARTEMEADASNTGNDESSMYLSGDFGKIELGQNDGAGPTYVTFPGYGSNSMGSYDIGSHNKNSSGAALTGAYPFPQYGRDADNNKISYFSPNMGGFSFGYSYSDEGTDNADTAAGLSYSTDMSGVGVAVTAMMEDSGESTKTSENTAYGVSLTSGAFDIGVSTGTTKTSTTVDSNTTIYGIGYAVSDDLRVTVSALNSENDVTNGDKFKAQGAGVNYTIASGLTLNVGVMSFEATDGGSTSLNNDGTVIRSSVKMSF
ncbi:MAG: porin [Candidatus Puniceispirillales bacterium]